MKRIPANLVWTIVVALMLIIIIYQFFEARIIASAQRP